MLGIDLSPLLLRALTASALISICVFGSSSFIAMRNLSFLVVEVAHAILCGASLGLLVRSIASTPIDPTLLSMLFGISSGIATGYLGERSREEMELAVGIMFALNMSLSVLFMSLLPPSELPRMWGFLIGDILLLTENDLLILSLSSLIIGLTATLFSKEFTYVSFDSEGAAAHGMNTRLYHYLMIVVISVATVSAVKAVGAILVYALMVIPGAVSMKIHSSTIKMCISSLILSLSSLLVGIALSQMINVPPSGLVGVILFLAYLLSLLKG